MVRFIHSADWQLGLRVGYIPGDAGAVVRDARLRSVRTLGELAKSEGADFVVVAGDVFEHHGLKQSTLRQTFDALSTFSCPVYLLPGNHDPYTPDSLYRSEVWKAEAPSQVHVLHTFEPVQAPGACLLPCPLLQRHTLEDPTEHLKPEFGPSGVVRVGVAHGGIREVLQRMGESEEGLTNALAIDAAEQGGLDYLALGDWHGALQVGPRTWYSGAHEATRFKEKDPGHVLVVQIDGPGAVPDVQKRSVGTLRWVQHEATVRDESDLDALDAWFEALPAKADTLVELHLEGTLDARMASQLDARLARQADRLRWLRRREERFSVFVDELALQAIAQQGWVREVIDELKAAPEHDESAKNALRLLYQLHQEAQS